MKLAYVFLLLTSLTLAVNGADSDSSVNDVVEVPETDNGDNNEEDFGEDEYEDDEGGDTDEGSTAYSASVSEFQWRNGRCYREVVVRGPGVDDVIPVDCYADDFVLANNTMLMVGSTLYSDSPNSLIVVRGTRCERRTYGQPDDEDALARTRLTQEECAAVRSAMVAARAEGVLGTDLQGAISNIPSHDVEASTSNFQIGF